MGMAASQARYLALTARKTNVEYEGQQINQARTALANQSANTFNELLALEVPTAPSTQDYTTTQYSYEDGTVAETITSMTPLDNDADGYNYLVEHYHYSDVYTGVENKKRNPQVYVSDRVDKDEVSANKVQTSVDETTGATVYKVNNKDCSAYDETDEDQKKVYDQLSSGLTDFASIDPSTLLTYKDAGGNVHFVTNSDIEAAANGTADASDYYLKSSKPTQTTISANTIASADGSYTVNGYTCSKYDETDTKAKEAYTKAVQENASLGKIDPSTLYTYTDKNDGIHFISTEDIDNVMTGAAAAADYSVTSGVPVAIGNIDLTVYNPEDDEQLSAYKQILEDWPDSVFANSESTIYTWESSGQRYFACTEDLIASWESAPDQTKPMENQNSLAYYCAQNVKTKIKNTERAVVDFDDSGRAESIKFEDSSVTRTLTTETVTDETAYNDAMNQYNYDQAVYEKKIQDINAKTEKIQEQDRTLELKLRQLDTEQEALQTEMEAVQKVIEKNIESTFKTFE